MTVKPPFVDRLARRLLWWAVGYANDKSEQFASYHERPKRAHKIGTRPEPYVGEPCAIVMQGPLATENDVSLETMRLYRQHFPDCALILSTWRDTDDALLAPMRSLGVDVVLSDKPKVPGLFNVNMQLVSAAAGVRAAAEKGVSWVLKTRTDQRLHHPDALAYLVALARAFPPAAGVAQRHRIIGVGHGSLKFAPYHVTDQSVFGHVDDMLTYWTPPLRETPPPSGWPSVLREVYGGVPIGELCRHGAAESYITSSFLLRIGRSLDWTLADTWAAYRDHFCFADYGTTDFYWVKSQTYSRREFGTEYARITNRHEFTFREWLLMQTGALKPEHAEPYEHVLEAYFGQGVQASKGASHIE